MAYLRVGTLLLKQYSSMWTKGGGIIEELWYMYVMCHNAKWQQEAFAEVADEYKVRVLL